MFLARMIAAATLILMPGALQAQEDKAEVNILNNRDEAVVMRFDYSFRDYHWNLIQHTIDARDEITYRYPSNIPGCEKLREWRITDGTFTISNARGPLCQKRISLCDKHLTTMTVTVTPEQCLWSVRK